MPGVIPTMRLPSRDGSRTTSKSSLLFELDEHGNVWVFEPNVPTRQQMFMAGAIMDKLAMFDQHQGVAGKLPGAAFKTRRAVTTSN